MSEQDTPTQVINIPGEIVTELTVPAAALYDDQERRALAIERIAGAMYNLDAGTVLAVADYVITGRNPIAPAAG